MIVQAGCGWPTTGDQYPHSSLKKSYRFDQTSVSENFGRGMKQFLAEKSSKNPSGFSNGKFLKCRMIPRR